MKSELDTIIERINEKYSDTMVKDSHLYLEENIGKLADELGFSDISRQYRNVDAIVHLKETLPGMKVMIDGRTFINYAQFDSGLALPEFVARNTTLHRRSYVPKDSMVLNVH